jgi:membrane protein DedA with SNARE-associated domain
MSESILHLVEHFGYAMVTVLILAEGLGLPLPGEASLVAAAAIAGTTGRLTLGGVILAGTIGAIGGAAGGYWIGASVSDARLHRLARRFGIGPERFGRAQTLFREHGRRTALLGRFVTLLRMLVALLAGGSRMPFGEFIFFSSIGAVLWTALYSTLGFLFGSNLPRLERQLGHATLVATLAAVLLVSLIFLSRRRRRASRTEVG